LKYVELRIEPEDKLFVLGAWFFNSPCWLKQGLPKDEGKTDFRNQVVPKTGIGFVGEDQLSAC
jgi:hypothetical protein